MKNVLKDKRLNLGLKIQEISSISGIDQGLLSKYEAGKRVPSEKHLSLMAKAYQVEYAEIRKEYLTNKIVELLKYESDIPSIMLAAESRMEYLRSNQVLENPKIESEVEGKLKIVDELKVKWLSKKPLNNLQLEKMQSYFLTKYTFESNQIEGNTMSFRETDLVINQGITVNGKSMREHLEIINHADAVAFIGDLVAGKEDINRRSLLDVHRLILKSIDQENAGKFRNVAVRITGSEHLPPEPYLLEKLMEDYFLNYENQKRRLHPVIMAAEMHERLVSIHPFIDGNGRTSRLIMNFLLLKNGFTVTSLKGDYNSRMDYYRALEDVQVNNNPNKFYNLILDSLIVSLNEHLAMV